MANPAPRPDPASGPIFSDEFYRDIAHEMDPEQEITSDAIMLIGELAEDFMGSVLNEVFLLKRKRGSKEKVDVEAADIHFVLQDRFGMSLPGATGPRELIPSDISVQRPTKEYQEKQDAVRQFAATHRDD
jgi:transcription initiation factor TFIID subunit TAF12